MTAMIRLRTPLLVLTFALAAVLGSGGAIGGSHAASTLTDGLGIDRIELAYHDGRLALRTYELAHPQRHLGLVGVESTPRNEAARHRRVAAAVALAPATQSSHLMLLTHQRNDLDA